MAVLPSPSLCKLTPLSLLFFLRPDTDKPLALPAVDTGRSGFGGGVVPTVDFNQWANIGNVVPVAPAGK